MKISQIMEKMIVFSEGNIHDIDHFVRVWNYAKTIAEQEEIDSETLILTNYNFSWLNKARPGCRYIWNFN